MYRLAAVVIAFLSASLAIAQNVTSSDAFAISLAQKSMAALTGGKPASDVTLSANVISILGSDNESGTATLLAKGVGESRVDLKLNNWSRSDVRSIQSGVPIGSWEKNGETAVAYAGHNCRTDAAWFFPALSSLSQTSNPNFVFRYIGVEQHSGLSTQHIQVFQINSGAPEVQQLSVTDFYVDPSSFLPLAINFPVHPDEDMNRSIRMEIDFSAYQSINGIQVPFHFQKLLNDGVILDVEVTSAVFNTGLLDSVFSIP